MAGRDMLEQLPQRLRDSPETEAVSEAMAEQTQELLEAFLALPMEFYAHIAGEAGLRAWERLTGLQPAAGATLEERRANLVSQLCAGGTTNAALIASMARAMTGYEAEVTENFGAYTFSLRFYGDEDKFIQIDTQQLHQAVELVKPAHLEFVIEPITWADLEAAELTWAGLEAQFPSWAALEGSLFCHKRAAS